MGLPVPLHFSRAFFAGFSNPVPVTAFAFGIVAVFAVRRLYVLQAFGRWFASLPVTRLSPYQTHDRFQVYAPYFRDTDLTRCDDPWSQS
jgi:hypothetical protein